MYKLIRTTSLAIIYASLSLIIGEYHPFSRTEMYNYFPDSAEAICLTNHQLQYVAITKYFEYKSDNLTHNYHTLCEYLKDSNEIIGTNTKIGPKLWSQLSTYRNNVPLEDTLNLVKVDFFIDGDSIILKKTILYEVVI